MENFKELLLAPKEFRPKNAKHVGSIESLHFSNVSFKHKTAKHPAVEDINFNIKQG